MHEHELLDVILSWACPVLSTLVIAGWLACVLVRDFCARKAGR